MLVIQEENHQETLHLDEVLLSMVPSAVSGGGAFAFATVNGLNAIFDSSEFRNYFKRYSFDLILGVDAITNINALRRASELMRETSGRLRVRIYHAPGVESIFHPKFVWFENKAQSNPSLIVGSGNLTVNGLQRNTEAFCWLDGILSADDVLSPWDQWVEYCEELGYLFEINDPLVVNLAKRNGRRIAVRERGDAEILETTRLGEPIIDIDVGGASSSGLSVMISGIPRQTGRGWSQFNMSKSYFTQYFGFDGTDVEANSKRRILLQEVDANGDLGELESRKGVISSSSHNYRIELEGARKIECPEGNPYVAFLRLEGRRYLYSVFVPGDDLYEQILAFAQSEDSTHRGNQLYRCIVPLEHLSRSIPLMPLVSADVLSDVSESMSDE